MVRGPGISKIRNLRLLRSRSVDLIASFGSLLEHALALADTISEGSVRAEAASSVYYGSTVLLFPFDVGGTPLASTSSRTVAQVLSRDPTLRVLALRIAHREAVTRSQVPISTLNADMTFSYGNGSIRIDVDVSARLLSKRERRGALKNVPTV